MIPEVSFLPFRRTQKMVCEGLQITRDETHQQSEYF
jgi:hypothetical protein